MGWVVIYQGRLVSDLENFDLDLAKCRLEYDRNLASEATERRIQEVPTSGGRIQGRFIQRRVKGPVKSLLENGRFESNNQTTWGGILFHGTPSSNRLDLWITPLNYQIDAGLLDDMLIIGWPQVSVCELSSLNHLFSRKYRGVAGDHRMSRCWSEVWGNSLYTTWVVKRCNKPRCAMSTGGGWKGFKT